MDITEKQFESQVKGLAKVFGWLYYHTWRSIHSPAGFPDCVMVRPPRLIFAELKTEKGKVSPAQDEWLDILIQLRQSIPYHNSYIINPEVYLWRPSDFDRITEILR